MNHFFIFLFISSGHVSLSTLTEFEIQEKHNDIYNLSSYFRSKFKCDNGKYIEKSFLCDGISDCKDNSDETHQHCSNTRCGGQFFQCEYGACINKEYLCDGLKQCNDGSDESVKICNKTTDDRTDNQRRRSRATNNMCAVPASTPDKTINYRCNGKQSSKCIVNGFVQESTVASVVCNPGYSTTDETYLESGCLDKKWLPPIATCTKKCEKLTPINVDLLCIRKGIEISCDLNSLLAGTVIRPTCKYLHTYSSFQPDYIEISCKSDGNWDKPLFSCTPQCGRPYSEASTLITGGQLERFGDSPWHVAIYNQDKELICGGTIINPQLILSAAHCFGESALSKVNAAKYEIAVSKVTRNYTIKDNQNQKIHKIKEIRFSKKGYIGLNNHYAADIVILILQQPVTISPTVLPACIDWATLNKGITPLEGTPGKVVGWGLNENGRYSENLLTVNLPYIGRERCLSTVPDDFKPFITLDKFCAGTQTGPGVLQGDSGGGLLFRENGLYYIRGIVSLKQPSITAIAAFTDLADHIQWVLSLVNEVKQGLIDQETTLQTKANQTGSETPTPTPTPNTKKSETIALANCEKYSKYATDCVHVVISNKGATNALPKEYPHNAYIGIDVDGDPDWRYSGVLISEKFVLSVAHYANVSKEESKWVLLGELDKSSKNDDAKPTVFSIVKQYLHPDFKPNTVYNDIALFQLNASVVISPYIRPACLYTSTFNPVNIEGKVTAFGVTVQGERNSDHLLRTTVTILNDERCRSKYKLEPNTRIERGYDPNTMICVGNSSLQENLCVGISGSPLQFPKKDQPCMTTIYGIAAISNPFCEGPDIYIKVPYYLDWIQSIVWP
ncbi:modular serine protease-like [Planococcus citri]|uniref:modular serine protease-like n=1 Tax=Planococcus citri TaxID=170843 RepID=UPI0031F73AA6